MNTDIIGKLNQLYLDMKICLHYFPGGLKDTRNLGNQHVLHFVFQCQKLLRLCHNTYILLFCIDLSTKLSRGL